MKIEQQKKIQFFQFEHDQPHNGQKVWHIPSYTDMISCDKKFVCGYITSEKKIEKALDACKIATYESAKSIGGRGSFHMMDKRICTAGKSDLWAPIVFPGQNKEISNDLLHHVGYDEHRLKVNFINNEIEMVFAAEWAKKHNFQSILSALVPYPTQRDAKVAATMIQWLGTNVGLGFLNRVIMKSPELGKYLCFAVKWREDTSERQRKEELRYKLKTIMQFIEEKLPNLQKAKKSSNEFLMLQMINEVKAEYRL